jgi:hypothetical protein
MSSPPSAALRAMHCATSQRRNSEHLCLWMFGNSWGGGSGASGVTRRASLQLRFVPHTVHAPEEEQQVPWLVEWLA